MLWFEITASVPPADVEAVAELMREVAPGGVSIEEPVDILVGDLPDDLPARVEFRHLVAVGQGGQGVPVVEADGRERPVLSPAAADLRHAQRHGAGGSGLKWRRH